MKKILYSAFVLLFANGLSAQCSTSGFSGLETEYSCPTTSTLTGTPSGGTFSGTGISGNTFDPSAAGVGTHWVAYSTPPTSPVGGYTMVEGLTNAPQAGPFTAVTLSDDQVSGDLPIGFNFDFYGNTYTTFRISSNGFISFDNTLTNSGCCSGPILPSTFDPTNIVALAWNDLNPSNGGTIGYTTIGTAPNRIAIIDFNAVPHYGGSGTPITAQIKLFETTNVVEIHVTNSISDGSEHTIGIENAAGSCASTATGANGDAAASVTNTMIQFTPAGAAYYMHSTGLTNAPYAGALTSFTLTNDEYSALLPIGFSFDFYGNNYTDLRVSSNGFITFDQVSANTGNTAGTLPDNADINDIIAFAWTNLDPSAGGTMGYTTIGTSPNQVMIIDFNGVAHNGATGTPVSIQVKLYETSNIIEVHSTSNTSDGTAQTLGVENSTGTEALSPTGLNNSTSFAVNNEMIMFYPYYTAVEFTDVISLTDVTPPVPDMVTLPDVTAQCQVDNLFDQYANDNCSGFIIGTNDAVFPITSSTIITWSYDDGNGNIYTQTQNVIINDNIAPALPGFEITISYGATFLDESTWTLTDNGGTIVASGGPYSSGNTGDVADVVTIAGGNGPYTFFGSTTGTFMDNVMDFEITCNGTVLASGTVAANTTSTVNNIESCNPLGDYVSCTNVTSLPAVSAEDNCNGTIAGTNDAVFPITTNTTVTWTFDDGNGNISTATQEVIIGDIEAPVPDVTSLPAITEICEVTNLTVPTAFDACSGTVSASTTTMLPITTTTTVTWTYTDLEGNTSSQNQVVNITDITPVLSLNVATITVTNPVIGSTYQWVDCDNGNAPIVGATGESYTPVATGNYAVEVTNGNCTEMSACQLVDFSGIDEVDLTMIQLYPNPANELVYIETANAGSIELYDLAGKLISQLKTEGKTTINTQALSVGTYNVRFLSDSGVTNVRLMINR